MTFFFPKLIPVLASYRRHPQFTDPALNALFLSRSPALRCSIWTNLYPGDLTTTLQLFSSAADFSQVMSPHTIILQLHTKKDQTEWLLVFLQLWHSSALSDDSCRERWTDGARTNRWGGRMWAESDQRWQCSHDLQLSQDPLSHSNNWPPSLKVIDPSVLGTWPSSGLSDRNKRDVSQLLGTFLTGQLVIIFCSPFFFILSSMLLPGMWMCWLEH